jgi:hypothetical protein
MAKRVLVLIVLWLMPIVVIAQDASREFTGWQWYDDGITFTYPTSVAANAITRFSPASADAPEKVQIVFENYADDAGWIATGAEIHIMPVSTLPARLMPLFDTLDALPTANVDDMANQLSQIVSAHDTTVIVDEALSLNFQTGSGTRFVVLTKDTQGAVNLSYWYLGKTTDNQYLVLASFPITVSNLNIQTLENAGDFAPSLESLDALLASLHITPPDATLLTAATNGQVNYEGIQFTYDTSLAYRVEVDTVAPLTGAAAEQTMFGVTPGYQRFTFVGFPIVGNIQSPQLFVMPVAEFPDEQQPYGQRLLELQRWLCEQPQFYATANPGGQNPLPILPIINAAQTIVSQPQYINFSSGQGLRYITYYSQGINPVTATDLFYTFAGISANGQYVVAATFPLDAAFLPQGATANDIADYDNFAMNYQTYLDGLMLQIDVMDGSAYVPQIHLLDAAISSIFVSENSDLPTTCTAGLP